MTTENAANTPENGGVSNTCTKENAMIRVTKNGPASAGNTRDPGLTPTKEGLIMDSTQPPEVARKNRVLEYLAMAREDLQRAERTRDYYTTLGRRYGLTWEEMGRALGTTGGAVRIRTKRAVRRG